MHWNASKVVADTPKIPSHEPAHKNWYGVEKRLIPGWTFLLKQGWNVDVVGKSSRNMAILCKAIGVGLLDIAIYIAGLW